MKKKQILWAIVFGSMLAITGCGDDGGGGAGTGGTAGTGGSAGGDFCTALCAACGGGQADCQQACDFGFGSIPNEILESCPSELETLTNCYTANSCDGDACDPQLDAWATCVAGNLT
jgi:hypothetical protein